MAKYSRKFPLPITELDRWIKNQSSGTIDFSSPGDGIWRADVKFTEGSSWTFPRFKLPEKLDLKTYSGFLVRARVLGAPQNASSATTAGNVSVIAKSGNGIPSFWVSDILPSDGEWQVVYVPFGEFKPGPNETGNQNTRLAPELWQSVEVGFNHGKENTFEISHLMLVGE